jgi:hypothetical protein
MRCDARRSAESRLSSPRGSMRAGATTCSTRSTAYTSEPRSLKTPLIPVCDAMPASLAFIRSNSAPSVSVRR